MDKTFTTIFIIFLSSPLVIISANLAGKVAKFGSFILPPDVLSGEHNVDREFDMVFDETYLAHFTTNATGFTAHMTVAWDGWVGFGISPTGRMHGADLFISGIFENGTTYSGDYHGINHTPTRDPIQNWEFISARENETHTEVVFSRLFDTGDEEHDKIIEEGSIIVLWAYGVYDTLSYHGGARNPADIVLRETEVKSN